MKSLRLPPGEFSAEAFGWARISGFCDLSAFKRFESFNTGPDSERMCELAGSIEGWIGRSWRNVSGVGKVPSI